MNYYLKKLGNKSSHLLIPDSLPLVSLLFVLGSFYIFHLLHKTNINKINKERKRAKKVFYPGK